MESSKVLSRSSLPGTGSPFHHRNINLEVSNINDLLEKSALSQTEKESLAASIAKVAKTCVKDAEERIVL